MGSDTIDELLERYLALLDEYTTLRSTLGKLQADLYHNLARANFSAERGFRYGQDSYDDRMQAFRRVQISTDGSGVAAFSVPQATTEESMKGHEHQDSQDKPHDTQDAPAKAVDPLRWFGVLTPMPLRQAQKEAVEAVERVIPRLATLSAEMAEVEIQVRRARKKRAKAEVVAKKDYDLRASPEGLSISAE